MDVLVLEHGSDGGKEGGEVSVELGELLCAALARGGDGLQLHALFGKELEQLDEEDLLASARRLVVLGRRRVALVALIQTAEAACEFELGGLDGDGGATAGATLEGVPRGGGERADDIDICGPGACEGEGHDVVEDGSLCRDVCVAETLE